MDILIDSNIIIYSLQSQHEKLQKWLGKHSQIVSAITQLEVLGYYRITNDEKDFANRYFSICKIISIDQVIIQKAIELRQTKQMSLGDAVIGATATIHNLPLVSANLKDFKHIENIELINPLEL